MTNDAANFACVDPGGDQDFFDDDDGRGQNAQ